MLKDIRERIIQKIKPDFQKYSTYIVFSIVLGIGLEFKLFDVLFDKPTQLYSQFLNQLLNISNASIDHSLVFSTSAAILSTVFTVIFVLLTVFIQMSGAHTSADVLQSTETKNLIRLYFTTIVLSLMMLETTFKFPILVLILTFTCILSLYPFLHTINSKFQYEVGVEKLSEEILLLIESNKESLVLAKMKSLKNISLRSIDDNRPYDFLNIMSIFETNTEKAEQQNMQVVIKKTGFNYLDILNHVITKNSAATEKEIIINTLFENIDSYFNNYTKTITYTYLHSQIYKLKEIGIKMIKNDFTGEHIGQISEIFYSIFLNVQKKVNIDNNDRVEDREMGYLKYKIEPDIVHYFGEIIKELLNGKLQPSSLAIPVRILFRIGAKTRQLKENFGHSDSQSLIPVVKELKKIEDNIGNDNFEKLFNDAKKISEAELEPYMDKFKLYYDENKAN